MIGPKFAAILFLGLSLGGCSLVNLAINPAASDPFANNRFLDRQGGINRAINDEIKKKSPNGWYSHPYSRVNWNKDWNSRIYHLYDLGKSSVERRYRGPSGPDLIAYILEQRKARHLPRLQIEPRNRDRVPPGW